MAIPEKTDTRCCGLVRMHSCVPYGGPGGETFGSAGFSGVGSPAPPSGPPPSSGDGVASLY